MLPSVVVDLTSNREVRDVDVERTHLGGLEAPVDAIEVIENLLHS